MLEDTTQDTDQATPGHWIRGRVLRMIIPRLRKSATGSILVHIILEFPVLNLAVFFCSKCASPPPPNPLLLIHPAFLLI